MALTLHAALTLAQAGSLTSASLRQSRKLRRSQAAECLARYAERGYIVRLTVGRPGQPGHYAITAAGVERLNRMRLPAQPRPSDPFGPLLAAMCSPFALGATGSR